jgi:hypothetical protein
MTKLSIVVFRLLMGLQYNFMIPYLPVFLTSMVYVIISPKVSILIFISSFNDVNRTEFIVKTTAVLVKPTNSAAACA